MKNKPSLENQTYHLSDKGPESDYIKNTLKLNDTQQLSFNSHSGEAI